MNEGYPKMPQPAAQGASDALLNKRIDAGQVAELRHTVASCAETAGLHGQRLEDFVLAVHELVTNVVRHGGGQGWLRLWRADPLLLCEVSDRGGGIAGERLRVRERPRPDTEGGWGLWLTRALSDAMTVRTGPGGTTVRISAAIGQTTTPAGP